MTSSIADTRGAMVGPPEPKKSFCKDGFLEAVIP